MSQVSLDEKLLAMSCLLELEGSQRTAKIGGVTRLDVSQVLPDVSVEIAALFYIRYLYLEKWDHCNGIALVGKDGKLNDADAVKKAFGSYRKWFERIKVIGIEQARKEAIDPMDGCRGEVRWY